MENGFKLVHYDHRPSDERVSVECFGYDSAKKVNEFHRSFPEYSVTPLVNLKSLSATLGIKSLHVKDESFRFGLNAFKVLGGSYAIGSYISRKLGVDIDELDFEKMTSGEVREKLGDVTFVTATDGNHGRGVAWTANRLKQGCVVYMPKGTAVERLDNIKALGACASITDLNYDDAVRLANEGVEKNGWVLIQDTSWDGYDEVPRWIMQGYTTMGYEIVSQLNGEIPTHIFLQAGVGAMSGAMAGFFSDFFKGERKPVITIVEPDKADCIFRTAEAADGRLHFVKGNMDSIMAGLCCGEPCTIAWEIIRDYADNFVSMPDYVTAKGMRILGNPAGDDVRVISGESGACTTGLVAELMLNESLDRMREQIGLNSESRVLCISTEGATDRENYRNIVWDGLFPSFNI